MLKLGVIEEVPAYYGVGVVSEGAGGGGGRIQDTKQEACTARKQARRGFNLFLSCSTDRRVAIKAYKAKTPSLKEGNGNAKKYHYHYVIW